MLDSPPRPRRFMLLLVAICAPSFLACETENKVYSLREASPLHVSLQVTERPDLPILEGHIHTSMPYQTGGCALDVDSIAIVVNGSAGEPIVIAGGHGDGECLPAYFFEINVFHARRGGSDVVEIRDETLEVRLESEDLLERRFWRLIVPDLMRAGARIEGQWSHPQDDLTGAIVQVRHLVVRMSDDPEVSFVIPREKIEVNGSSFFFTVPDVPAETVGVLEVEIEKLPLDVSCVNATCDAQLTGRFQSNIARIYP